MSDKKEDKEDIDLDANNPEVKDELSQVATNPKQRIAILVIIVVVSVYFGFKTIMDAYYKDSGPVKQDVPVPDDITRPVRSVTTSDVPSIPNLPEPPELDSITPPPPPPPEPMSLEKQEDITKLPEIAENEDNTEVQSTKPDIPEEIKKELPAPPITLNQKQNTANISVPLIGGNNISSEEMQKRQEAKKRSSIMLINKPAPNKDSNKGTAGDHIDTKQSVKASIFARGKMDLLLGRGKFIDAVIENALNTDFGGEIRAIVSRDVYSEWGKNILIPKGSKLFGTYATSYNPTYGRIAIVWERIDLINGHSLIFSGDTVDNLGRPGVTGRVDEKFKEKFTNAVLMSAFNILTAKGLDKLVPPQTDSQQLASRTSNVENVRNLVLSINGNADITEPKTKITQICAQVPTALSDKTSATFIEIQSKCTEIINATGAQNDAQNLIALISTINSSLDKLLQVTTQNTVETQAQQASKQAYTDLTEVIKQAVETTQGFQPNATLNQGEAIKIYINKDYEFPETIFNH